MRVEYGNGLIMLSTFGDTRRFEIPRRRIVCAMYFTLTKCWLSKAIVLFLFLTHSYESNAQQVLQTNRYELPVEKDDYFQVIPSQEDGIFLHRRLYATSDDKIEIIKLDTSFNVNWKGFLSIDKKIILMAKRAVRGHFYL